jgi:hypothetical protein
VAVDESLVGQAIQGVRSVRSVRERGDTESNRTHRDSSRVGTIRVTVLLGAKDSKGLADTEVIELPEGFEERTKERGVVCTSWAPQLKILAHDSVGGFLTHSGWSSVVESLQFERPLILLTFYADQGINAKVLDEKKIGYLIPRNEQDGSFTRDSVAESLRLVIVEEEGKAYRDKAKEMKGCLETGIVRTGTWIVSLVT